MTEKPMIVLVHGAFSDGTSWSPVAMRLLGAGADVRVPAISNRSLAEDAAYVRAFVRHLGVPVLLVGHSYGATVVGVAGDAENVRGIVFVSGYALDVGESAQDVHSLFPDSDSVPYFERTTYANPDGTLRDEISVAVDEFPLLAASGVPADEAGVLAVMQRPLAASVLVEKATTAAWRERPTWGIVSSADRTINPDAVRYGYTRAGVRTSLVLAGPHLIMHTHPGDVARLILDAAGAVL